MEEHLLSDIEKRVLDYIRKEKEVKFADIKSEFGDRGIGTVGKLKKNNLVDIIKHYSTGIKTIKSKV